MPTTDPFVHTLMEPTVPTEQPYSDQRYFGRGNRYSLLLQDAEMRGRSEVKIYRYAADDHAEIISILRAGSSQIETSVSCTADQLREIASRLLDAAHDLDVNPASKLAAQAQASVMPSEAV